MFVHHSHALARAQTLIGDCQTHRAKWLALKQQSEEFADPRFVDVHVPTELRYARWFCNTHVRKPMPGRPICQPGICQYHANKNQSFVTH